MRQTRTLRIVVLAVVLAGIGVAAFVGGALGALGGLVALLVLMVVAGGFTAFGRTVDRGAGEGRPVSTDFGGDFDRPSSEGDLL